MITLEMLLGGSSQLVSGLVHPSYKRTLPLLSPFIARANKPTYDSWDGPPSIGIVITLW